MNKELIYILEEIKKELTDKSDMLWTSYETAEDLRIEIDCFIVRIQENDKKVLQDMYVHFLPTSTFQEHALQNNWSEKYMYLAQKFDAIYEAN